MAKEEAPKKDKERWRFIDAVMYTAQDLSSDPEFEKEYNPWFIATSLSYHRETIAYADNVNRHQLPKAQHFAYLLNIVPKRRRFAKFHRPKENEALKSVQEYFKCNEKRAREYMKFLTVENLQEIFSSKGGEKK